MIEQDKGTEGGRQRTTTAGRTGEVLNSYRYEGPRGHVPITTMREATVES